MKLWFLGICLILGYAAAASTTTPVATTGTVQTKLTTTASSANAADSSTTKTGTTPVTTPKSNHNVLLRKELAVSPVTHRLRGRVVLANTRVEGNDEWGVSADQAEVACDRIARYQYESPSQNFLLRTLLRRFIQVPTPSGSQPMEGHLLSVGSGYEVMALSRLLNPLPEGAYWTGGKLTRYRVNNMRRPGYTDHIVLTWTDGRAGRPSVLGMTKIDEQQLREGYTYCLALNLREAAWQARDCSDQLPYACLITPRQIGFSNQASEKKTTEQGMKPTTESASTEKDVEETTETSEQKVRTTTRNNLMQSEMVTTPESTPMTTEFASTPGFEAFSETTEGRRENVLADMMATTPSTMSTKMTPSVMLDTKTTTESNLLEEVFTSTTKPNLMEQGKEMFTKMTPNVMLDTKTTTESNLLEEVFTSTTKPNLIEQGKEMFTKMTTKMTPNVMFDTKTTTESNILEDVFTSTTKPNLIEQGKEMLTKMTMPTTRLPELSEVLPTEQMGTEMPSMKTTNSLTGKSTTENRVFSTAATTKSTMTQSASPSATGMQTTPTTTAQTLLNSRIPRNWEEDEDENNDEEE